MPQMAPMNWTFLFLIFVCLFIITLSLIYFSSKITLPNNNTFEQKMSKSNLMWKW